MGSTSFSLAILALPVRPASPGKELVSLDVAHTQGKTIPQTQLMLEGPGLAAIERVRQEARGRGERQEGEWGEGRMEGGPSQ